MSLLILFLKVLLCMSLAEVWSILKEDIFLSLVGCISLVYFLWWPIGVGSVLVSEVHTPMAPLGILVCTPWASACVQSRRKKPYLGKFPISEYSPISELGPTSASGPEAAYFTFFLLVSSELARREPLASVVRKRVPYFSHVSQNRTLQGVGPVRIQFHSSPTYVDFLKYFPNMQNLKKFACFLSNTFLCIIQYRTTYILNHLYFEPPMLKYTF